MTLEGENVNNWSELITIQKKPRNEMPLKSCYKQYIETLQRQVPHSKVYHRLIAQDDTSIFFEWWINEPSAQSQHEWNRMIQSDMDCFIVRYTTKKLNEVEKIRSYWEEKLLGAHLGSLEQLSSDGFEQVALSGLKTSPYVSQDDQFSIQIPTNWEFFKLKNDKTNPLTHLFKIPNNEGSFLITVLPMQGTLSSKQYLEQQIEVLTSKANIQLIQYETITCPNGETIYGAVLGPHKINDEITVNIFIYFQLIHDKVVMFYATAPLDIFDQQLEVFKAIAPTFKY